MSLKDEPVTLSEKVHIGEDKELLRKQLELLKSEYERTAQRLQRAKRKEEIRKHVQKKISDQNWPLQNNMSVACEISSECSSVSNLLSNQNLETSKKVALVRFQLPEEPKASGWGTPTCRRCPTQRLRSKRSRLRLQNRGAESDTDHSQEKEREREAAGHGVDERVGQKNDEKNQEVKWAKKGNNQEMERALGMEWKGIQAVEEKSENGWKEKAREGEDDDERHYKSESNGDPPKGHQKSVDPENSCQNLLPAVGPSPMNLRDVDVSPADRNLQSSPAPSLMQLQSCQSALSSGQSETDMSGTSSGADKSCEHMNGFPGSSGEAAFLDSCTVIEGLPFPVEYYVRTTRRMAAANSSIDLDAIIHSQLTGGRRRRRYSPLQTRSGGVKESAEPGAKPHDQLRGRGRSQRGRRGRGQKRVGSMHIHSSLSSGVAGCSQVEPSPEIHPQSESSFLVKSAHQIEPVSSTGPALTKMPVSGFKHLLDTQLYLDCQLLPDSDVYPIFRKRQGLTGGTASQFECQNDFTPFLPSLASLVQALRTKDVRNLGQLLTTFDVQDFHLPDDEFGQLKLERLCSNVSYANVEPLTPHTNMSHIGRRRSFRIRRNTVSSGVLGVESEVYTPELLPPSTSLDCSFPLSQLSSGDQSQMKDVLIETSNSSSLGQLKSGQDEDQADEDQMTKCQLQASLGLVELQNSSIKLAIVGSKYDIGTSDKEKVNRGIDSGEACPALPAVLNLSLSSTSFTQRAPDPFVLSLGMTPRHVSPSSTLILNPFASSPSDRGLFPNSSQTLENGPSSPIAVTKITGREVTDCQNTSSPQASIQTQNKTIADSRIQEEESLQSGPDSEELAKLIRPEGYSLTVSEQVSVIKSLSAVSEDAESLPQEVHQLEDGLAISKNEISTQRGLSSQNFHDDPDSASKKAEQIQIPSNQHHGTTESARQALQSTGAKSLSQDWFAKTSQCLDDVPVSDVLQKTHTLKALDEGCVLDACLLELTSEHWVLCVADEWSVYAWARSKGAEEWSLLHMWTFTQSIISLQAVLDSAGLLCVSLGRLEITEVRTLYCSTAAGEFSQTQVCVGALQAVCVVCECRLVCCSVPGVQQQVTVFTLTQEGGVADSHALASTERSVHALAAVEGQRDALIGWTECHTLLIWNMKSGLLLQSLQLTGAVPTSTCLRGYSYEGALCVLLQSTAEDESLLFALIAANPLTGKHTTLSSITHPTPHTARLLDGDVCGSSLVAVFRSGRLALWDMRGGGAVLWVGGAAAESCHLAKWAGPNMLIIGHTNGDVGLFHYKVPHNMKSV